TALAEEDDVLSGEDRVLDLRDDRRLEPDDPLEERRLLRECLDQVGAQLFLHRARAVAGLAKRADRGRSGHSVGSPLTSCGTRARSAGSTPSSSVSCVTASSALSAWSVEPSA